MTYGRSSVPPKTPTDKKLSVKHLKDSVKFNKRHITEHKQAMQHGGSSTYNKSHIQGHKKALAKDKKLLKQRESAVAKLKQGMAGA